MTITRELSQALRGLVRRPGFALLAAGTLALGLAANAVIAAAVYGIIMAPPPFAEPDRLTSVYAHWTGFERGSISVPQYLDLKEQATSFESVALWSGGSISLAGEDGEPRHVRIGRATSDLFPLLRAEVLLGRAFDESEDLEGADDVVILSERLWRDQLGADPEALDTSIEVEGRSRTVIGVMPASFTFPTDQTELWLPYGFSERDLTHRGNHSYRLLARMTPGASVESVNTELDTISHRLREEYSDTYSDSGWGLWSIGLRDDEVAEAKLALWVLGGAVALVLLIACANVANLMMARVTAREQELALRAALGAGRGRLVAASLAESVVLALVGGALGLLLAYWGVEILVGLAAGRVPRIEEVRLGAPVLGYTLALAGLTGLIFGAAPALAGAARAATSKLGMQRFGDRSARRLRGGLVLVEVMLAVMLLIGAGLLLRTFWNLRQVDPGFSSARVQLVQMNLVSSRLGSTEVFTGFVEQVLDRAEGLPGVESAAMINSVPLIGWNSDLWVTVDGYEPPPGAMTPSPQNRVISPAYFETMGIRVDQGRAFASDDRSDGEQVAIVNRAMANRYWPEGEALGGRVKLGDLESDSPWMRVVGVVADVKHRGLSHAPGPMLYRPITQGGFPVMSLLVRSRPGVAISARTLAETVQAVEPRQAVHGAMTLEEAVAGAAAHPRLTALLLSVFAGLAVALSAIGIYGVLSYTVGQRRRDIGVGLALGARGRDVVKMALGREVALAFGGAALGLAGALLLTRLFESLLFEVEAGDPLTYAAVALGFALVALLAALVPARRATGVDPAVVLRGD